MLKRKIYDKAGMLLAAFLLLPLGIQAFEIKTCPNHTDPLSSRWEWAKRNKDSLSNSRGVWVGYSIKKLMRLNTFYFSNGMCSFGHTGSLSSFLKGKSLGERIYGARYESPVPTKDSVREMARRSLDHLTNPEKKYPEILKDVAVLFMMEPGKGFAPGKIVFCNLSASFEPDGRPVVWLGTAKDEESFFFLKNRYAVTKDDAMKRKLLSAVGLHSTVEMAVPFLTAVLKGKDDEKVRGRAAVELGEFDTQKSVDVLFQAVKTDKSSYVRKRAVYGLEDIQMDSATDALIWIARQFTEINVRKSAISALGDIASRKASKALQEIVYQDDDTVIQKFAVYALEDLPNNEGIPLLIKIAKSHPKVPVRKSAIHCLGDSGDPRALDTLIEIIKN